MNVQDSKDPTFISILGRAFSIMECMLLSDEPLGVSQLSRTTGIPKANAFRILKTLESLSAITPAGDGYVLGSKMMELGAGAKQNNQLMALVIPHMQNLAAECSESVNFGVPFQGSILILHTELSEQRPLVALLPPITPMYCSSIGKLFLAQKAPQVLEQYFHALEPKERTINTILTMERFLCEQQAILQTGISHDKEEYDYGLSCMAAPVTLHGELIAGLSLSGPTSRLCSKGYARLEDLLRTTAEAISSELTAKGAALPWFG